MSGFSLSLSSSEKETKPLTLSKWLQESSKGKRPQSEEEATGRVEKKICVRSASEPMETPSAAETKEEKSVDMVYSLERERKVARAEEAYHQGEVESFAGRNTKALVYYRQSASLGHPSACLWLLEYYRNTEAEDDEEQAAVWVWTNEVSLALDEFRKQAQKGDARAQYDLAQCYKLGIGGEQNDVQAVSWYYLSALQNYARAQFQLGVCHHHGSGMSEQKPNPSEAVNHYEKAAAQGHSDAQNALGWCYEHAFGIEKDLEAAFDYFHIAAQLGNAAAQSNLGMCYENGFGISKDAYAARQWYAAASEQGLAEAHYNLARCIATGIGGEKSLAKAWELYQDAADQGFAEAEKVVSEVSRHHHPSFSARS